MPKIGSENQKRGRRHQVDREFTNTGFGLRNHPKSTKHKPSEVQTSVGRKEERVSDDGKRSSQTEYEEYAHWMPAASSD